jgi:hypothetical protein
MTAVNTDIGVATEAVLLTNKDVSVCRVQNKSSNFMLIQATVGATPPASFAGAIQLAPGQGEYIVMTEAFPGVVGATRLYAISPSGGTTAGVSHA